MKSIYTALALVLFLSSFGQTVDPICSAAQRNNTIIQNDPAKKQLMEEAHQWALQWTQNHYGEIKIDPSGKKVVSYVIPVVWHIVHNNGPENVSRATIDEEMVKLNEDFQKMNYDLIYLHSNFAGIAADCEIEFRMARLDPDGNCTEGITRTVSSLTNAMDESAKFLPGAESWNRNGRYYLNIWMGTAIASGAGGYAYYPGSVGMDQDGIVLRYQQLGNTVTHEVGHWLNLPHCWGSTNNPGPGQSPDNCSVDDGVADTPNTLGQTGCSETTQSCGSLDNVQNYMEYNFCSVMFTEGQKQRMHATLNSDTGKRLTMCSLSNLALTGTDDPYEMNPICAPVADFTYNREYLCEGDQVTYTDDSYNAVPTGWNWTFEGGTPNTSNLESPTVTYNTAGIYKVTHEPFTTGGAGYKEKTNIITVSSIIANYTLPFSESFENTTTIDNEWSIITNADYGWSNVSTAAASGTRSMRVLNLANESTQTTELISPSYDLTSITNPALIFKHAYAQKTSGGNDQLIVYYSTNCGHSWSILNVKAGGSMATASPTNGNFTPTAGEWEETSVNLNSLASYPNVKFKFYVKNNGGNNIWLDDINITSTTGIQEIASISNFSVYPNPTKESATISFNLSQKANSLSVSVKDVLGKTVTQIINQQSFNAGKYTLKIDEKQKLSTGLYFIVFNIDGKTQTKKLVVQ